MSENAEAQGVVLPYIALRTLQDLLTRMAKEEPPARIDKSYLSNYSGGYQTQVLAALTALDLIDAAGTMSQEFLDLVAADDDGRRDLIAGIVRKHYGPILALGTNATQQMMVDAFSKLAPKATGDTRRKVIAFFLAACGYGRIAVSKHWSVPRVAPSGKPRKPRAKVEIEGEEEPEDDLGAEEAASNVRQIELRSGGVVSLSLSVDLFALTAEDRTFVFALIDKMSEYENQRVLPAGTAPVGTVEPEGGGG